MGPGYLLVGYCWVVSTTQLFSFVQLLFIMISQSNLQAKFHYCPESGAFTRRIKSGTLRPAGTLNSCGYVRIVIDGVAHLAHRLAWLYTHGVWPIHDIDHRNGNRADNRLSNLRDVPRKVNAANRASPNKNNRAGLLGVSRRRDKWIAQICIDGTRKHLGMFATAKDAAAAYAKARQHTGD